MDRPSLGSRSKSATWQEEEQRGPRDASLETVAVCPSSSSQERLLGAWAYGSRKVNVYEVGLLPSRPAAGAQQDCLCFCQRRAKGTLSGTLRPTQAPGEPGLLWMEAELRGGSGEPHGRIRLRPLEGRDGVISNFCSATAADWSGDTHARRVMQPFYVDRRQLPTAVEAGPGLGYRLSTSLSDKDGTHAAWGSVVVGARLPCGWVKVENGQLGSGYLPTRIGDAVVLTATDRLWRCEPRSGERVGVRVLPQFDGPQTGEVLCPGDEFRGSFELKGGDAILHVKLADGRGWVPSRHPYAGQLCVPSSKPHAAPLLHSQGSEEADEQENARDEQEGAQGTPAVCGSGPLVKSEDATSVSAGLANCPEPQPATVDDASEEHQHPLLVELARAAVDAQESADAIIEEGLGSGFVLDRTEVLGMVRAQEASLCGGHFEPMQDSCSRSPVEAQPSHSDALLLHVHGLGGRLCSIQASRGWTIRKVKVSLEAQVGISRHEQRLLFGTAEPYEAELLSCLPEGTCVDLALVRRTPEEAEWLLAAEDDWPAFEKSPEWVRCSRVIMYAAVQQAGHLLHCAADELRQDRGVVLASISQSGYNVQFAAGEMQADQGVALAAVRKSGPALRLLTANFGSDVEVVLAAVQQDGLALEHASTELKAHMTVVQAAVQQNGLALQFVALRLRERPDLILLAVRQNGLALRFAASKMRADLEVALAAVQQHGLALEHVSQELRANHKVALAAVQQHKRAIHLTAPSLRADRSFFRAVVQQNGLALQNASQMLRADADVVLAAVGQDGLALQFASQELRADLQVVLSAVRQNETALRFAAPKLATSREVLVAAERSNRGALPLLQAALPPLPSREGHGQRT